MTKKFTSLVLTAALALSFAAPAFAQADQKQPAKKQPAPPIPGAGTGGNTPHATIGIVIGSRDNGSRVTVTYGRPFAVHPRKGGEPRKIWGGLVAWDKPDRMGADEATTILTEHPLEIQGKTIPAGLHTLYIIPSENGVSKLAFSKKVGGWGVPVNVDNDVARFDLKKEALSAPVDQLTIAVRNTNPAALGGTIEISWERTKFSLPFTVKK